MNMSMIVLIMIIIIIIIIIIIMSTMEITKIINRRKYKARSQECGENNVEKSDK